MQTLLEDPLPVLFVGLLVEALLGLAFFNTKRWEILVAIAAVALGLAAAVVIEAVVVTEREQVEAQLDAGVRALVADDREAVLRLIAPEATLTRHRAEVVLQAIKFNWIRLRDLQISINRLTVPPTAEARFRAAFQFEDRTGVYPYRYDEVGLVVELTLTDAGWLVTDHIELSEVR
jgi:hypothetical protein